MVRIGVAALALIAACSSGTTRVGGQPSWRQGHGGDDALDEPPSSTRSVTVAPVVQVKLVPSAVAAAAYNDRPRALAPSSPVGDAIAREILALAPAVATPVADGRMYRAAADLAKVVPSQGVLPYPVVEFAMQHHGIIEPSPNMLVVWGPLDQPELLVENLRPRLAELLHGEPLRRFGVGTAQRGDRGAVIVMLQSSYVDTEPFPRALAAGGAAKLIGRVLAGFAEPEAFVTRDDGVVERLPLALGANGAIAGDFACGAHRGRQQVEIAAEDHTGSTVLANFPVWCGEPPPDQVSAEVDPDDARPVTSAADAEARMLVLLNRDRAVANLPALEPDPAVAAVARAHSADMRDHDFVGHVSPTTGSASDRVDAAGIKTGVILENIARAYGVAEAQAGLMNSPGHRANALSTAATRVGIGITLGAEVAGRRELFVTQVFTRVPPPIDRVAGQRTLVERLVANRAIRADVALDRVADRYAASLAAGLDRKQASTQASADLETIGSGYRQAASVVTAVTDLDAVDADAIYGGMAANRLGVGFAQGPHPELGPGTYWIVVIMATAR